MLDDVNLRCASFRDIVSWRHFDDVAHIATLWRSRSQWLVFNGVLCKFSITISFRVKVSALSNVVVGEQLSHLATQAVHFLDRIYVDGDLRKVSSAILYIKFVSICLCLSVFVFLCLLFYLSAFLILWLYHWVWPSLSLSASLTLCLLHSIHFSTLTSQTKCLWIN